MFKTRTPVYRISCLYGMEERRSINLTRSRCVVEFIAKHSVRSYGQAGWTSSLGYNFMFQ